MSEGVGMMVLGIGEALHGYGYFYDWEHGWDGYITIATWNLGFGIMMGWDGITYEYEYI